MIQNAPLLQPHATFESYVLIAGRGRSGTNFLLSLLDQSPLTYARNEPNKLDGSALSKLPGGWIVGEHHAELETGWDNAIQQTALAMGERDHLVKGPKYHLRPLPRRLGLYKLVDGPRSRQALARLIPSIRGAEWPMPGWIGDHRKLAQALPVIKLNQAPGWFDWVLRRRPRAKVIHIVRHPGGFLNSWRNRWLTQHDSHEVKDANNQRLKQIAAACPDWARRFGDVDAMGVEESELWFWSYTNEVIYQAGKSSSSYLLVIYERLAAQTVDVAREVYEFCELPWTQRIEREVRAASTDSLSISNTWQEKLNREQIELVNRTLSESPLNEWWR